MALQNIRSNTSHKRPTASGLSDGQIAINTNADSPGLFFKDAGGALIKVGPVHIGTSAPNSVPAGSSGNAIGEQWLDTSNSGYVFKIWDGTAWRSETGQFVDVAGDTMTGDLTIDGADLVMSDGEIIAETGSASTPSITFTGDLDTGFYKPAADELAISTGGTGRVFIDDSGNVGIGTTAPGYKLQISEGNTSSASIKSSGDNTTARAARLIYSFSDGDGASINATRSTSDTASDVNLSFRTGGITNSEERMRIDNTGNVGIGTSNPQVALDLQGETNTTFTQGFNVRLTDTRTAAQGVGSGISFRGKWNTASPSSVADFAVITGVKENNTDGNYAGALILGTRTAGTGGVNTERMRISSTGNVGIGTTNPGASLDVQGGVNTGAVAAHIRAGDGGSTVGLIVDGDNEGGDVLLKLRSNSSANPSDSDTKFIIEGGGNVGIGTTSPVGKLNVLGTGSAPSLTYDTDNLVNIDQGGVQLAIGVDPNNPFGAYFQGRDNSNNARSILLNPVNGNVGIGTSTPTSILHIRSATPIFTIEDSNGASANSAQTALLRDNDSYQQQVRSNTGSFTATAYRCDYATNGASRHRFFTENTQERLRITSDGKVGIGTSSPSKKLTVRSTAADQIRIEDNVGSGFNVVRDTTTGFLDFDGTQESFSGFSFSTTPSGGSLTERFRIENDGDLLATDTSIGSLSDQRLKENINDFTYNLEDFKQYQPKTFDWKNPELHTNISENRGFIAQEVEAVDPYWVSEARVDPQIADAKLLGPDLMAKVSKLNKKDAMYISVIQQLIGKIETLEQRLTDAGL